MSTTALGAIKNFQAEVHVFRLLLEKQWVVFMNFRCFWWGGGIQAWGTEFKCECNADRQACSEYRCECRQTGVSETLLPYSGVTEMPKSVSDLSRSQAYSSAKRKAWSQPKAESAWAETCIGTSVRCIQFWIELGASTLGDDEAWHSSSRTSFLLVFFWLGVDGKSSFKPACFSSQGKLSGRALPRLKIKQAWFPIHPQSKNTGKKLVLRPELECQASSSLDLEAVIVFPPDTKIP